MLHWTYNDQNDTYVIFNMDYVFEAIRTDDDQFVMSQASGAGDDVQVVDCGVFESLADAANDITRRVGVPWLR